MSARADAEDAMVRGYLDGFKGREARRLNHPAHAMAYHHGYLNGQDDLRKEPRAPAQELRERAENILSAAEAMERFQ